MISKKLFLMFVSLFAVLTTATGVFAHGVDHEDAEKIAADVSFGEKMLDFFILGAKHMMGGYDHLLFVLGIVFLLTNFRDVIKYVTYFTIGHSITLMFATYLGITYNYYIIEAIIGLSVIYKGFDNLYDARKTLKIPFDTKWIVLGFGLIHGFGLSTRLQELHLPEENLLAYILSFNIGVEVGQLIVLSIFVFVLSYLRKTKYFDTFKVYANQGLIGAGLFFMLVGIINAIF